MLFDEALQRVLSGEKRSGGIGIQKEKTVHAMLKYWLDDDTTHHEVPLPEGCVADIFDGERVTEIQTASFSALRKKLEVLLPHYPVTVVHPLIRRKTVVWIDPATGETTPPHHSSRVGGFADGGRELIYLLSLLSHPHLTVRLILLDVEEHRRLDGWGNGGKRGSHREERYPTALVDTCTLVTPADYRALVPENLPEGFTAAQFGKAARQRGRTLQGTLKVLLTVGVLTREKGERGAYHYYRK